MTLPFILFSFLVSVKVSYSPSVQISDILIKILHVTKQQKQQQNKLLILDGWSTAYQL